MSKHLIMKITTKTFLSITLAFGMSLSMFAQINFNGVSLKGKNDKSNDASASYNFHTNPYAPTSINHNLAVGTFAVAVDENLYTKNVRILEVLKGGYLVCNKDATNWELQNQPNMKLYYSANSVYPFVDAYAFKNEFSSYMEYIKHYVKCYSDKNAYPMELLQKPYTSWPTYILGNQAEIDEHKKKLAEFDALVKAKYSSIPNMYLPFEQNPAVWAEIGAKREEYIQCLIGGSGAGQITSTLAVLIDDIYKTTEKVKAYTAGGDWKGDNDWMFRAMSPSVRKSYFEQRNDFKDYASFATTSGQDPQMPYNELNKALDALKLELDKKLPIYKAPDWLFKYHDVALEAIMKNYLKNAAALKIHKIGISDDGWIVVKDALNYPLYQYRRGQMLVRNPNDDFSYCKVLYFVLKKEHLGGGKYGQATVSEYTEELVGCP